MRKETATHQQKDPAMTETEPDDTDTQPPIIPHLQFDWQLYASMLDDSDIAEEQKQQFLECLWSLIVNIIDMGIGIHPLQQNGHEDNCSENLASLLSDVLDSDHSNKNIKNTEAADGRKAFAAERQES